MKWKIGSIALLLALFIAQAYTINPAYIETTIHGTVFSIIGLSGVVIFWKRYIVNLEVDWNDIPKGKEKICKILKGIMVYLYVDMIFGTLITMCCTICVILHPNPI